MHSLISHRGIYNEAIRKYIVDIEEDLVDVPTDAPAGSECFVIGSSTTYILNHNKEWIQKMSSGGSGGVTSLEITPNISMGSLKPNYPAGTSLEEIIRDMLMKDLAPSVSIALNPSKTLYTTAMESIESLAITTTVVKNTNDIEKIEYYINGILMHADTNIPSGGTSIYTYNQHIENTTTIKVLVRDIAGHVVTASKKIEFVGGNYYGLINATISDPTEDDIKTLNKTLQNNKQFTYNNITSDWARVCYAYPSSFGELSRIYDKVSMFTYTDSFTHKTLTVNGIEYYVYTLKDPIGADSLTLIFE